MWKHYKICALLSLRVSVLSSNSATSSGFIWSLHFWKYFSEKLLISSLIDKTLRSLLIQLFDTNHGPEVINLKVFDWYLSRISIFDLLDVPHNIIPYVETGYKMALFILILLFKVNSDFGSNNQYSLRVFNFKWVSWALMCRLQISLLSKIVPS